MLLLESNTLGPFGIYQSQAHLSMLNFNIEWQVRMIEKYNGESLKLHIHQNHVSWEIFFFLNHQAALGTFLVFLLRLQS